MLRATGIPYLPQLSSPISREERMGSQGTGLYLHIWTMLAGVWMVTVLLAHLLVGFQR